MTTAEIALASEEVIAIVCANIPASTSPTRPCGSRLVPAGRTTATGRPGPAAARGAAHIGKNRTSGQTRYRTAEESAALRAWPPVGAAMYRWARFHVPPLYGQRLDDE